jgi:hypothetical protein
MLSRPFKIGLLVVFIAACAVAITGLYLDNARLRARIADSRRQHDRIEQLRAENRRAQALVTQSQTDEAGALQAIHRDVVRVRGEVVDLEKRAADKHALLARKTAAEAEALASNRDPSRGLTRLEHFQDVGQATPAAAFQTLVRAALNGDEAALARLSTISPGARTKAEALIARLPENSRAQWTPEKFAAMFFTGAFAGEVAAAQMLTETPKDPEHVALSVRINGAGKDATIPFLTQLGPTGWQVVFDEKLLGAVQKKIAQAEPPPEKK